MHLWKNWLTFREKHFVQLFFMLISNFQRCGFKIDLPYSTHASSFFILLSNAKFLNLFLARFPISITQKREEKAIGFMITFLFLSTTKKKMYLTKDLINGNFTLVFCDTKWPISGESTLEHTSDRTQHSDDCRYLFWHGQAQKIVVETALTFSVHCCPLLYTERKRKSSLSISTALRSSFAKGSLEISRNCLWSASSTIQPHIDMDFLSTRFEHSGQQS